MIKSILFVLAILGLAVTAACSRENQNGPTVTAETDTHNSIVVDTNLDIAGSESEPVVSESAGELSPAIGAAADIADIFVEAWDAFYEWLNKTKQELADCMYAAGFPQNAELLADSLSVDAVQAERLSAFTIHPHELGPYTESQAREFGLAGSIYIRSSQIVEPGNIVSNDPAYNSAHRACIDDLSKVRGSEAEAEFKSLNYTIHELRFAIDSELRGRARNPIGKLLADRSSCVGDKGYAYVDPERAGSWEDLLQYHGIEAGETLQVAQGDETPAETDFDAPLGPGETRLILSSEMPAPKYYPSAEEVELALTFVRCMEEIDFLRRLEELQIPIRAEVLADYETEILGLRERLDAILAQ